MGGFQIWQAISRFNLNQKTATDGSEDIPKVVLLPSASRKSKSHSASLSVVQWLTIRLSLLTPPFSALRFRHPPTAFVQRTGKVRAGSKGLSFGFRLHLTFFCSLWTSEPETSPSQCLVLGHTHSIFSWQVWSCTHISHMPRPPSQVSQTHYPVWAVRVGPGRLGLLASFYTGEKEGQ